MSSFVNVNDPVLNYVFTQEKISFPSIDVWHIFLFFFLAEWSRENKKMVNPKQVWSVNTALNHSINLSTHFCKMVVFLFTF